MIQAGTFCCRYLSSCFTTDWTFRRNVFVNYTSMPRSSVRSVLGVSSRSWKPWRTSILIGLRVVVIFVSQHFSFVCFVVVHCPCNIFCDDVTLIISFVIIIIISCRRAAATICHRPSSLCRHRSVPRAAELTAPAHRNVAVGSHAQYVRTLTAAAA